MRVSISFLFIINAFLFSGFSVLFVSFLIFLFSCIISLTSLSIPCLLFSVILIFPNDTFRILFTIFDQFSHSFSMSSPLHVSSRSALFSVISLYIFHPFLFFVFHLTFLSFFCVCLCLCVSFCICVCTPH